MIQTKVIKKDGTLQDWSPNKIARAITLASERAKTKLTDEELGVALKTIRFIGKNKKVEDGIESNTQNNTNDSNNNIKDNTNEENDDEKNTLKDEIQTLKDEIAKLKGINNEVPNSNIKDKTEEKTNKFGFNF